MKSTPYAIGFLLLSLSSLLTLAGCGKVHAQGEANAATAGAPPDAKVELAKDSSLFSVDHPEQFPLAAATARPSTSNWS